MGGTTPATSTRTGISKYWDMKTSLGKRTMFALTGLIGFIIFTQVKPIIVYRVNNQFVRRQLLCAVDDAEDAYDDARVLKRLASEYGWK